MTKINFVEPVSEEWLAWKHSCNKATTQLLEQLENGVVPKFNDLYKAQKTVFIDKASNFYGKCAYCESLITNSQPGDVDHYRPKGRVMDENNKPILITTPHGEVPHPGYYWLAYKHFNLLPSCVDCNRPSSGNSGGLRIGKWNQFPVVGLNAFQPGDEVNEEPLIINPVTDEPDNHLEIDELGILHSKDNKGQKTIDIFGLNLRESLVDERKRTYATTKNLIQLLIIGLAMDNNVQDQKNELDAYKKGERSYSIAGRKALTDYKENHQELRQLLN